MLQKVDSEPLLALGSLHLQSWLLVNFLPTSHMFAVEAKRRSGPALTACLLDLISSTSHQGYVRYAGSSASTLISLGFGKARQGDLFFHDGLTPSKKPLECRLTATWGLVITISLHVHRQNSIPGHLGQRKCGTRSQRRDCTSMPSLIFSCRAHLQPPRTSCEFEY